MVTTGKSPNNVADNLVTVNAYEDCKNFNTITRIDICLKSIYLTGIANFKRRQKCVFCINTSKVNMSHCVRIVNANTKKTLTKKDLGFQKKKTMTTVCHLRYFN